ncbi:AI-2 transport protein TqsA [Rosistilla ulvae]|uniref:AI-2 transport protein TqsA n=1 Tax=Rosistilla ulvae TaxID=1930277 RepID=A0A517M7A2_9BACT|nr:AI-2E family transporter [Rosistilla ulvae]QDS90756.1 AI-2 transport protein TqsA [Rosistilla ulvae]
MSNAHAKQAPPPNTAGVLSARICAVTLVLYGAYYARSMIVPIVTAVVLYLVLRPLVRHAQRLGVPPALGAIGTMVGLLVLLSLGTFLVLQPAKETIAEAPRHVAVVKEKLSTITDKLKAVDRAAEDLTEPSDEAVAEEMEEEKPVPVEIKQPNWTNNLSYLSGTGNVVSFLTICGAMLYFLLATGDNLLRSIVRALPNMTARRRLVEVLQNVQEGLGSYLAQVTTINACLGLSVGIALWILGMPSPVLWGVMAFAFNFIPLVGAIAGACIIFVVALVNFEPTYYAFVVTGTFLALTSLEGQFLTPAILGRSMSMSPVLVFVSIVVWGWMWGVVGVFLSVPILIAARMTCESYDGLAPLATILGAADPAPATTSATVRSPEPDVDEPSQVVRIDQPATEAAPAS